MRRALGVATPHLEAEETLRRLRKLHVIDYELQFERNEKELLIPILGDASDQHARTVREQFPNVTLREALFAEAPTRPHNLVEALGGMIPEQLLPEVPRSFDIIGDIAVIELPERLYDFSLMVGNAVLKINPNLRLAVRKSGEVAGTFRTRKFEPIAGSGSTETFHREYACLFHLDIGKVYFNPRLANERMRIARQVRADEIVVDMFAGVGPYSIVIAKTQPAASFTAIDMNPEAVGYLKENVFTNKVADRVTPMFSDAREAIAKKLRGSATRVIMNLPSEARAFLDAAAQALGPQGGLIHYYTFASRSDELEIIRESLSDVLQEQGRRVVAVPFCKAIREVAPNRVQVAVDIKVK